jgi:hypothetical protein
MIDDRTLVPVSNRETEWKAPAELLADLAEKRPGTFLITAAAIGLAAFGLIGYSIYKGRSIKMDFKGFDVSVE